MIRFKLIQWVTMLAVCLGLGTLANAQNDGKVYAVLLYSPTCPHCHKLITEDLPPIQAQFGEQLTIFYVDVSDDFGNYMAQSAYQFYNVPIEDWVVPMVIVGDEVLIGGIEIPERLPGIIKTGISSGGINVPQFPAMQSAYEAWLTENPVEVLATPDDTTSTVLVQDNLLSRISSNLLANGMAIVILTVLVLSALWFLVMRHVPQSALVPRLMIIASTMTILFLALSILFGKQQDNFSLIVMLITVTCTVLSAGLALFSQRSGLAISFITMTGFVIAGYLTYIETSAQTAVCGLVGDCNAVQQSPYAFVAGIPVGLLGLFAYAALFILSVLMNLNLNPRNIKTKSLFNIVLWLSIVFTIYLTFLEPFVIGSSCAWCLSSALVVINLMWIVLPIIEDEELQEVPSKIRAYQHV